MTQDEDALARKWLFTQRVAGLAAAAFGILALALIQATDRTSGPLLMLSMVALAVVAGLIVGSVFASIVVGGRGRRVRRPGSTWRFVASLVIGGHSRGHRVATRREAWAPCP